MRWSVVAAPVAAMFASLGTGCGGGGEATGDGGSIPVETVELPTSTRTYRITSSAMEPTLHCARPASGCEAVSEDRVVLEVPVHNPERGDVLVFETPPGAEARCGAGGTFVKQVVTLPDETWEQRDGYVGRGAAE